MTAVRCFLVADTGRDRVSLRRFQQVGDAGALSCPVHGYHTTQAMVLASTAGGEASRMVEVFGTDDDHQLYPRTDRRWPIICDCGYLFVEADRWQVFRESLWTGIHPERGGIEEVLREMPPGAMWNAHWYEAEDWRGPDGLSLIVRLPNGTDWFIDGRASNSTAVHGWERTGVAPDITARPSIDAPGYSGRPRYHGWLTGGVLTPV